MEQNVNPRLALIGLSGTGPWCFFDPLASEPHVTARSNPPPFSACDVISFNSQRQRCLLTWAE